MTLRIAAMAFAALIAAAAPGAPVAAQQAAATPQSVAAPQSVADSVLEARTAALASQLRCPVCQGLSIQDSPSELSQQMRAVVKDQLREGKTPDQVKAYFISKYGEWILLEPKAHGFNVLVYAMPVLLVALGLGVIVLAVRKWTRPPDIPA
ncbi:MAG TPA: cytochrome c-type biogenesis protein [Gemmatimonadaceae bacterium]